MMMRRMKPETITFMNGQYKKPRKVAGEVYNVLRVMTRDTCVLFEKCHCSSLLEKFRERESVLFDLPTPNIHPSCRETPRLYDPMMRDR